MTHSPGLDRPGSLLVVGTPIGNLEDLSPRARTALANADRIACEDTRRTGRLLQLVGLPKRPLLVLDAHRERDAVVGIVEWLRQGETIALVSDAGMPGISDPGELLIRRVVGEGLPVEVVPGPTALVSALVLSGLSTERFVFEGFLPRKGRDRSTRLAEIAAEQRTTVFYESPKRVRATITELGAVCGLDRTVAVARELTKLHEQVLRGTFAEVGELLTEDPRGEVVVVVGPSASESKSWTDAEVQLLLEDRLQHGSSTRDAVGAVVAETGEPKRRIYDLAVSLRSAD